MVGGAALEGEPKAKNGVKPHQMGQLDHVAQGIPPRMPGICDLGGHVGGMNFRPVHATGKPHPTPPALDGHLGKLALP